MTQIGTEEFGGADSDKGEEKDEPEEHEREDGDPVGSSCRVQIELQPVDQRLRIFRVVFSCAVIAPVTAPCEVRTSRGVMIRGERGPERVQGAVAHEVEHEHRSERDV